jgi:Zincin-like metallopeptidase
LPSGPSIVFIRAQLLFDLAVLISSLLVVEFEVARRILQAECADTESGGFMPNSDVPFRRENSRIWCRRGIIPVAALCELCRYRHNVHWTGTVHRLNRSTLVESYRFGDLNYAKEELRAELTSMFLMAERGVPHDPDRHAAYLGSWLEKWRARHFSSNHQQIIM